MRSSTEVVVAAAAVERASLCEELGLPYRGEAPAALVAVVLLAEVVAASKEAALC